jgi:hypothetical protein
VTSELYRILCFRTGKAVRKSQFCVPLPVSMTHTSPAHTEAVCGYTPTVDPAAVWFGDLNAGEPIVFTIPVEALRDVVYGCVRVVLSLARSSPEKTLSTSSAHMEVRSGAKSSPAPRQNTTSGVWSRSLELSSPWRRSAGR